mgnify:CR=1 FL=1
MTKLFIHSTDPELAKRMKPEIYQKILEKREALKQTLDEKLANTDTITLEIGCGHGHFLSAYGEAFPHDTCIGIDVNKGRIYKALRNADRAMLENVAFYDCDSMEFLALLPEHVQIAKTWILYPDPWPKKRHFKNRIIQTDFLNQLADKAAKASQLFLRSDYQPYLEWTQQLIEESEDWQLEEDFVWPEVAVTVFQELTKNKHYSLAAVLNQAK